MTLPVHDDVRPANAVFTWAISSRHRTSGSPWSRETAGSIDPCGGRTCASSRTCALARGMGAGDDDGDGRAGRPGTPACLHRAYGGAQIAGLAISQDLLAPPISDRLREAADRTRFPVVDVSIEVPFVALSRTIAAANTEGAQHRLVTHLGIFDTLGPRRPRPPSRAPAPHGTAVGLSAVPVLARRSSLLDGVAAPPQAVAEHHLPRRPAPGIPGGYIVTIPLARRTAGLLVALDRDDAPAGLTAVQHRDGRRARARQPRARGDPSRGPRRWRSC